MIQPISKEERHQIGDIYPRGRGVKLIAESIRHLINPYTLKVPYPRMGRFKGEAGDSYEKSGAVAQL